jgi:hypothetical protein
MACHEENSGRDGARRKWQTILEQPAVHIIEGILPDRHGKSRGLFFSPGWAELGSPLINRRPNGWQISSIPL